MDQRDTGCVLVEPASSTDGKEALKPQSKRMGFAWCLLNIHAKPGRQQDGHRLKFPIPLSRVAHFSRLPSGKIIPVFVKKGQILSACTYGFC